LPNRQELDPGWGHQEWEPGGDLTGALENISLLRGMNRDEDLANLKPHLEEALVTLERLERQRGLSGREKTRMGTLRMLLTSIERVKH
jgi:hypothetical protein